MIADVFNMDNPIARSILAKIDDADKITMQIVCYGVVEIYDGFETAMPWAYFEEDYVGPGKLHRPYLVVNGTISELYMDDSDPRTFPCGAKRLFVKTFNKDDPTERDKTPARVNWRLSSDELAFLFSRGLGKPDFRPPDVLRGNRFEIPLNIIYQAGVNTPISAVKILDPGKLETSTKLNGYTTMFVGVQPSEEVLEEQRQGGLNVEYNIDPEIPFYETLLEQQRSEEDSIEIPNEIELMDDVSEDEDEDAYINRLTEDERKDMEIAAALEQQMWSESDEIHAERKQNDPSFNAIDALNIVQSDADRDALFNSGDIYGGSTGKTGSLKLSDKINALKSTVQNMSDASSQGAYSNDSNGYAVTDMTDYSDMQNMSDSERDKLDARTGRKAVDMARRADIAEDNRMLNENPNADISGQGARASDSDNSGAVQDGFMGGFVPNAAQTNVMPLSDSQQDIMDQKSGKKALDAARRADIAEDNKLLNENPNADISGQGGKTVNRKNSLLSRITNREAEVSNMPPQSPVNNSDGRYL